MTERLGSRRERVRRGCWWAILLALLATPASGQRPAPGAWFEETTRFGFRVRTPQDWRFIPPSPSEPVAIARYMPAGTDSVPLRGGAELWVRHWLAGFDLTRVHTPDIGGVLLEWLEHSQPQSLDFELIACRPLDMSGQIEASERVYEGRLGSRFAPKGETIATRVYLALYELSANRYVAAAFNAPGDEASWDASAPEFRRLAESFERLEVQSPPEGGLANMPGWRIHRSDNYVVLSDSGDESFIEELGARLEAIRAIFERDFPSIESALEAHRASERTHLSVRVFADRELYMEYGGPLSSAGYWSAADAELVLYDSARRDQRAETWRALNHEAFHQFLHDSHGQPAPHCWFDEGIGDFYSGYTYDEQRDRFECQPFEWRRSIAAEIARSGDYVPLEEFTRWSKAQFLGRNKYGFDGFQNYAQSWSLIWFLRQGAGQPELWDDSWSNLLDSYLRALTRTGDSEHALEAAFGDVDWDALEAAWRDYVE